MENISSIKEILEALVKEIEELKIRVSRLENREGNVILEEIHSPEVEKLIGRKILLTGPSGQVRKVITHPTCDICGRYLAEDFIICQACKRKICDLCAVKYNGKTYCQNCLRDMIPLKKKDFKLLMLLANKIGRISEITEYSGMRKEDVLNSLRKLKAYKLVIKRGLSILSEIMLSENGLSVFASYSKIYGNEKDVIELAKKISSTRRGDRVG